MIRLPAAKTDSGVFPVPLVCELEEVLPPQPVNMKAATRKNA
jgi:hypothetical protein